MVVFGPEGRKGGDDKVLQTEEVGHIDCKGLNDYLRSEEFERADEGDFEMVDYRAVRMIGGGVQRVVASFLAELCGFQVQKLGRVRFSKEEKSKHLDKGAYNRACVKDPTPRCVLRQESASYGTNSWAEKRSETVDANCQAPFICAPAIAKRTTTNL